MINFAISLMLIMAVALHADSCRQSKPRVVTTNVTPTPIASAPVLTDDIEIDFKSCAPRRLRIDVAFGSTTFEIKGRSENGCLMEYGGEVENPNGNELLNNTCVIPFKLGKQRFKKTSVKVDFSSLDQYCIASPRR